MFSDVSKIFDRPFIVATLIPVVLFACIQGLLFHLTQQGETLHDNFAGLFDPAWQLPTILVAIVIAGALLELLNQDIIRFLEGYYGLRGSYLHRFRKFRFRKLYGELELVKRKYCDEQAAGSVSGETQSRYTALTRKISVDYPGDESLVLPTRLGNVIRSFEHYPDKMYSMDAIATWPRLLGVVPKDYLAHVDGAKTDFDFFLNCTVLAATAGIEAALLNVVWRPHWSATLSAAGCFFLALLCYNQSVATAKSWGAYVKSCFDLFRHDLLKKLGYKVPASLAEERLIWDKISLGYLYRIEHNVAYEGSKDQKPGSDQKIVVILD